MIVDAHPRDLIIALDPLLPQSTVVLFLPYFLFYACLYVGQIGGGGNSPIGAIAHVHKINSNVRAAARLVFISGSASLLCAQQHKCHLS